MLPSYYITVEESHEKYKPREYLSNPRYYSHTRFHEYFTAGDAEQFQETIQQNIFQNSPEPVSTAMQPVSASVWGALQTSEKTPVSELFRLTPDINVNQTTAETYDYISHEAGKGAYVEIRGGKVITLLPFQNMDLFSDSDREAILRREMGDDWQETVQGFLEETSPPGKSQKFCIDPAVWRLNGPLIRCEDPPRHNVSKFHAIENMLQELVQTRAVPDCAFFLYNRDYPILREDGKTPNPFWETKNIEGFPDKFIPILSMTSMAGYADIPYPHWDDWARVSALENPPRFFRKSPEKEYTLPDDLPPFEERQDVLVFRGGTTGAGITAETNPRLVVVQYNGTRVYENKVIRTGETTPDKLLNKTNVLIDTGLTALNRRMRKLRDNGIGIIPEDIPTGNQEYLSYADQARNKYILNLDGHVTAFRLSMELASGSVVFLQENSPYSMWYKPYLTPYVHYVPVEYNLSNLTEQIQWCISHQTECAEIAANARQFYDTFLSKDGILDYWQTLLYRLTESQGENRLVYPIEAQIMNYATVAQLNPSISAITPNPTMEISRIYRTFPQESWTLTAGLDCTIPPDHLSDEFPRLNRRVVVSKHRYSDDPTAIIVKRRQQEMYQTINENFVGRNIVNSLLQYTPCFAWTLKNSSPSDTVYMLNVPGESLLDLILAGDYTTARKCIGIIGMALVTGQYLNGLCMNKLNPADIILRRVPEKEISFVTPKGVYVITTDVIPTMVDYTHARGWTNDQITAGLYGYASRYTPRYGLDMICLAACTVKEFLKSIDNPVPDMTGIRQVFDGFVDIPDLPHASKWSRQTLRSIKRWVYAPYMDTTVDLQQKIPGIDDTTKQLLSRSLSAVTVQKINKEISLNSDGLHVAVIGAITQGINGVKEQVRRIYRCGFYVNSMLEKEYRKQLVMFYMQGLLNLLRASPDLDFGGLVPYYETASEKMLKTCFIGEYLLGLGTIPSPKQLSDLNIDTSSVKQGPDFLNTLLVLQNIEKDSPLFSDVNEYMENLCYRNQSIATINAAKWLG